MPPFSRSELLAAAQCERRAWLHLSPRPTAQTATIELPVKGVGGPRPEDIDEVRALARALYPGGVAISQAGTWTDRASRTRAAMAQAVPALFDATFVADDVAVRASILVRDGKGWMVAESKVANTVGLAQELDVAAVGWVAAGAGVAVTGLRLFHLDRDYTRGDGPVDPAQLFVSSEVDPVDFAEDRDRLVRAAAARTEPEVAPGPQCHSPRACPFQDHCIAAPGPYSVQLLPGGGRLHQELLARGIHDVRKIPSEIRMNPTQQHAAWAITEGKEYVGQGLAPALGRLAWPLRFVDFEACNPAVPRWPGSRPFEQIPTQWSIHTLVPGGKLSHAEFLHVDDTDPRPAFARSLVAACGSEGSIIVYGAFEAAIVRQLAARFPEMWGDLDQVHDRIVDFQPILRHHYYHPELRGSFSMKAVLGAACPDLGYGDLAIADGFTAARAWLRMVDARTSREERERLETHLLAYCARDSLAMVKVREALMRRGGITSGG
ncbi:MAG: DUF2779 domain-containing protein [Deltaproteobacteria bacterium]|nr:DUF2779 domain-containing protein [Deltaproteobacteria bacterium]